MRPRSDILGWLARRTHRLHRLVGSGLAVLLATWFASGAVMTFGGYPSYTERERLGHSAPLTLTGREGLPPELEGWLAQSGLAGGEALALRQVEGEPRWLFTDLDGTRKTLRTQAPWHVTPMDEARARAEAERILGARARRATRIERLDQWTIGSGHRSMLPLWHVELTDPERSELYLCARTGELVQEATAAERRLAWVGAIPHWIYPAALRRDREAWRSCVLWLAGLGLVVTLSGLVSGLHVFRKRARGTKGDSRRISDAALRWHQRLGLGFGALACTWLFSGALSLNPFHWTGEPVTGVRVVQRLRQGPRTDAWRLRPGETWMRCAAELDVRELETVSFGDALYTVCLDPVLASRVVRQDDSLLTVLGSLDLNTLAGALRIAAPGAVTEITEHAGPDDYYYPSHSNPDVALPFARIALRDPDATTLYVTLRRARVLALHTSRTRLERWLYHGLHSFDWPALYARPVLWQALMLAAMATGFALSMLGLSMAVRRIGRRRRA